MPPRGSPAPWEGLWLSTTQPQSQEAKQQAQGQGQVPGFPLVPWPAQTTGTGWSALSQVPAPSPSTLTLHLSLAAHLVSWIPEPVITASTPTLWSFIAWMEVWTSSRSVSLFLLWADGRDRPRHIDRIQPAHAAAVCTRVALCGRQRAHPRPGSRGVLGRCPSNLVPPCRLPFSESPLCCSSEGVAGEPPSPIQYMIPSSALAWGPGLLPQRPPASGGHSFCPLGLICSCCNGVQVLVASGEDRLRKWGLDGRALSQMRGSGPLVSLDCDPGTKVSRAKHQHGPLLFAFLAVVWRGWVHGTRALTSHVPTSGLRSHIWFFPQHFSSTSCVTVQLSLQMVAAGGTKGCVDLYTELGVVCRTMCT